jgi:hypothetical protein
MMATSEAPPERVTWIRLAGIVAGVAISATGEWYIAHKLSWDQATAALVLGALLVALLLGRPAPLSATAEAPGRRVPFGWRDLLGGVLVAAGMSLLAYASYWLLINWTPVFDWAAPAMVAGVASWSFGLALIDRRWRNPSSGPPVTRWEIGLLLAVLAFGFFLRFYRYDFFPPNDGFVAIEEPQSGMGAWDIMFRGSRPWEFLLDRWMPLPFFHYLGITITALRIPFTIVSGLTLLATYLLARQLVSPPSALFGTLLLAMARWHLNYARLAHAVFPGTLVVIVIYALCVRQHKRGGLALYPWIGFWTGYTLYCYAGYRGTPVIVGVFLLVRFVVALRDWRRSAAQQSQPLARRRVALQAIGMLLAALALAAPLTVLAGRLKDNPAYFLEAANRSYQNKLYYTDDWDSWIRARIQRQIDTAKIFLHFGDSEQAYNLPGEPMLDPVSGVLFFIALFYCLLRWRHRLQGFVVFTFLFVLIAGATLTQTLVVCRMQGVVPLIFVLIAFAADRFIALTTARFGRRIEPVLVALAAAVASAALWFNYEAYFQRTMHSTVVRQIYRNYYTTGIVYLHAMPANGYMVFVSDMNNLFNPNDYSWWRGDQVPGSVTADLLPILNGKPGAWNGRELHILIQEPFERVDLMQLIHERFPDADCHVVPPPEGFLHLIQTACILRSQQPQGVRPASLHARYFRADTGAPVMERDEPVISWGTVPDVCEYWGNRGLYECRVEWEGDFAVAESEELDILGETRQAELSMTVDGEPVTLPMKLSAGIHKLRAEARFRNFVDIGVRVKWRKAGAEQAQLLRFEVAPAGVAPAAPPPDAVPAATGTDESPNPAS